MSTNEQNNTHVENEAVEEEVVTAAEELNETAQQSDEEPISQDETVEVLELKKQLDEAQQKLLRVQADFDNFRRRTSKEKEDLAKYASSKVIENLLSTIDNFERALATSSVNKDYDSFVKGVDMIFRNLTSTLENEGLTAIQAVGEPFNPEFHQAVMQVESEEYEEGIVVEELQKGYILKDRVIRPAMVKVSG